MNHFLFHYELYRHLAEVMQARGEPAPCIPDCGELQAAAEQLHGHRQEGHKLPSSGAMALSEKS